MFVVLVAKVLANEVFLPAVIKSFIFYKMCRNTEDLTNADIHAELTHKWIAALSAHQKIQY